MFLCPRCTLALGPANEPGSGMSCPKCHGRALASVHLRKQIDAKTVATIWSAALESHDLSTAKCPSCQEPMRVVPLERPPILAQACTACQFAWFDTGAFEQLPRATAAPRKQLDPRVEESLARLDVLRQRELAEARAATARPELSWQTLPGLFGLPVEVVPSTTKQRPGATWILLGVLAIVSTLSLSYSDTGYDHLAFRASDPWWIGVARALSSFFVADGWVELIVSLYLLWLCGRSVEERLRPLRYVALIALSTLAGAAAHALTTKHPEAPLFGPDGGLSGVIAYYALSFPRRRLCLTLGGTRRTFSRFTSVNLSVRTAFFIWAAFDFAFAIFLPSIAGVALMSTIGGLAMGALFWLATGHAVDD